MSTEKPIIFSPPMIRAILRNQKRQTRRIVKPQPVMRDNFYELYGAGWSKNMDFVPVVPTHSLESNSPYGRYGGKLWVRENVQANELMVGGQDVLYYPADGVAKGIKNCPDTADRWLKLLHYGGDRGRVVPSIHMPKWSSRIELIIKSISLEKISYITESAAKEEGVFPVNGGYKATDNSDEMHKTAKDAFRELWDSINGTPKPVFARDENNKKIIDHYVSYPFEGQSRTDEFRDKAHHIIASPWVWVLDFWVSEQ